MLKHPRLLLMLLMAWIACKHGQIDSYEEVFVIQIGDPSETAIKALIEKGIDTATIEKYPQLATEADTLQRYEKWKFVTNVLGAETNYEITFWLDKDLVYSISIDFKEKSMEAYSRAIALLKTKFPTAIESNRVTKQDCTYHLWLFDTTFWLSASYDNKHRYETPSIHFNWLNKKITLDTVGRHTIK